MDLNKIELTIDDVVDAWGEYYLNSGQNMTNLHMLPFEEYDSMTAGTVIETDQTVLREANVDTDEVLQQYQDDFTSKGGVSFKPVEIFLQNIKIDVGIIPHKLIKAWTGFLTNSSNLPETYPFIQWLIEQYLLKQGKQDFELKSIYGGVYEAPAEGVAGDPTKVIDGIKIIQDRLVAAGKIDVLTTGDLSAMTAKDMVTALEDLFVKEIPEKYRYNYQLELSMSRTLRDKFKQGMRDKYNVYYQQVGAPLLQFMDFENITIVGRASMINQKRVWTTPKTNLFFPVKGFSNRNGFDVQKVDRKVKFLTDWWQGVGIIQPALVFMNEGEAA